MKERNGSVQKKIKAESIIPRTLKEVGKKTDSNTTFLFRTKPFTHLCVCVGGGGLGGLESIPADFWRKVGYTSGRSPIHHRLELLL